MGPATHIVVGVVSAASLAILSGWGIVAKVSRRDPGRRYERGALAALVVLVVQASLGAALLAQGHRRPGLHYFYGVAPIAVLGIGTLLGFALARDRWVPIAWGAAIALALAVRAAFTGR